MLEGHKVFLLLKSNEIDQKQRIYRRPREFRSSSAGNSPKSCNTSCLESSCRRQDKYVFRFVNLLKLLLVSEPYNW